MGRTEPKKGRPDLQGSIELDAHLIATAARLFVEQGYEGTSMGQVAAAAGAGKQSLYRRYANKEALFKTVFTDFLMRKVMAQWGEQMATFATPGSLDPENSLEELRQIARISFDFMLKPETVESFRLFVAERARFPELKDEVRGIIQSLEDHIMRRIQTARNGGLFRSDIDEYAARNLLALINEGPLVKALLELPSIDTEAKRAAYFEAAWKMFIDSSIAR